jgi:hypothetical protein
MQLMDLLKHDAADYEIHSSGEQQLKERYIACLIACIYDERLFKLNTNCLLRG